MSDPNQTASADIEPKTTQALEQPVSPAAAPASEPVDEWDKERAMATIKAQRESEKKLKEQLKDYERLKTEEQKRVEAQMTETERLQKQAAELAAKNAKLESDILRRDVITETGLPPQLADRLKGDTREALLADAQELLKVLPQQPKKPSQTPTNPGSSTLEETDAQMRERLFGKQTDIFNLKTIKDMGGGVVIHTKE